MKIPNSPCDEVMNMQDDEAVDHIDQCNICTDFFNGNHPKIFNDLMYKEFIELRWLLMNREEKYQARAKFNSIEFYQLQVNEQMDVFKLNPADAK